MRLILEVIQLCTCNKCDTVYIDTNPCPQSKDYDVLLLHSFPLEELPTLEVIEEGEKELIRGCPKCNDDGNLMDNVNPNAGPNALAVSIVLETL